MHARHQGRIADLRREGEGELGGLRGPGVRAHVHVGRYDARVEEEEGVGVVQAGPVQLVERGLEQVAGVPEFTGEIVGGRPAAHRRYPLRQRGVAEPLLRLLETPARRLQVPGVQGAFAEPEQRRRLLGRQPVRDRLREQRGVRLGGDLGLSGGERALRVGQPQPQVGGEVGGAPGRQLLVGDPEPLRDVPQRRLGGAHTSRLQGGDVRRGIGGFRQLFLRQAALRPQLLHPAPDDLRVVPLRHGLSMPLSRVKSAQLLTIVQLPWPPCEVSPEASRLSGGLSMLNTPLLL